MVVKSPLKPIQTKLQTLITGDELFEMADTELTELVKGEIVRMSPTGLWHGYCENKFGAALEAFVRQYNLGIVSVGEVGIYTGRNPDTVRAADVVFISRQRLAQMKSHSYLDVAPDLVIEVMSPNDTWSEVMNKLEEYFNIGVMAVWVAEPKKKQVYIYHSLTDVERFTANEVLPGGKALPDFSVPVAELFPSD